MNINDFEEHINSIILERGYDYYIDGNIVECACDKDNTYVLEIDGTDEYQVVVQLNDKGEIIYSECNCPYDYGDVCKHEAAAYYYISKIMNKEKYKKKQKKTRKDDFKQVLKSLTKENLIDIIMDLSEKDKMIKNSILLKYSKSDNKTEMSQCKKLIKSIVKKHCGRDHFIYCRNAYNYVIDMEVILDKAKDTKDFMLAIDIALLVLDEAMEALQYADDSNGDIGMLISESLNMLSDIVLNNKDADMKTKEDVFLKLIDKSQSSIFSGWDDMKISMLNICKQFVYVDKFRNMFVEKINTLIKSDKNDFQEKYINEQMLKMLYEIVNEYGTETESINFIEKNIKYSSFREILINKYMSEKNYDKVIELTVEGEKADKEYAGLVFKWKKLRYNVYKKSLMKKEQQKLGEELLLNGEYEYYNDLKKLADDKKTFYENIKQKLKSNRSWRCRELFVKILYEEDDTDELLEYVKNNPSTIENHAEKLMNNFSDEVIDIYKQYIAFESDHASNRSNYRNVCTIIKRFKKIAGADNTKTIINGLAAKYMRRPAFLDELNKIKI